MAIPLEGGVQVAEQDIFKRTERNDTIGKVVLRRSEDLQLGKMRKIHYREQDINCLDLAAHQGLVRGSLEKGFR